MITLTQTEIDELALIAAKSFSTYTVDDAIRYYEILSGAGSDYATLALSVVVEGNTSHVSYASYNSVQGQLANAYSEATANDYNVGFTIGSTNWLQMQHRLLQNDWQDRSNDPTQELSRDDVDQNHTNAFDLVGLPPETYTLHTPLSQIAEYNPALADTLWNEAVTGDGFLEFLKDGFLIFNPNVSGNQTWAEIIEDYQNQAVWIGNVMEAIANVGITNVQSLLPTLSYPDFWSDYDSFNTFQSLPGASGGIDVEYGSNLVPTLSTTFTGTRDWFGVTITGWWDPLVFDLDGDGVSTDLDTVENVSGTEYYATYFDIDGDGYGAAMEVANDNYQVQRKAA